MNQDEMIQRGDIFITNLNPNSKGSIQRGLRPVIVISNDMANRFSPVITVIPLTSNNHKNSIPTHVEVGKESGLLKESIALVEQITCIEKRELIKKVGHCSAGVTNEVNIAIMIQSGLTQAM